MIAAAKGAAALEGPEGTDLFDHADQAAITAAVRTDGARIAGVQRAAGLAGANPRSGIGHGFG